MRIVPRTALDRLSLDPAAIAQVPESVARDAAVLPVRLDGNGLYIIVPSDVGLGGDTTIERLNYALKTPFNYDYADRSDLNSVVALFYTAVYAEIDNCDERFQFRCPKRFAALTATNDPAVRFCATCQRSVYFCWSEAELETRAKRGDCAAIMHIDEPQGFLGMPM